jgi:hypothetical protein
MNLIGRFFLIAILVVEAIYMYATQDIRSISYMVLAFAPSLMVILAGPK